MLGLERFGAVRIAVRVLLVGWLVEPPQPPMSDDTRIRVAAQWILRTTANANEGPLGTGSEVAYDGHPACHVPA